MSRARNKLETNSPSACAKVAERGQRVALTLVVLVACGVYANTLGNELVYDDRKLIPANELMHDPWRVDQILVGRYWGEILHSHHYRPLTVWTLAFNYWANESLGLPGAHEVGFHLVNAALHAGASCAFYLLMLRLGLAARACLALALLFAVYPVHTEAVAFITGRAEPLALLFGASFLALHHRGQWKGAGVLYWFSLLSKESAVVYLFVALWMDICTAQPLKARWRAYGGYGLVLGGWLLLRQVALGTVDSEISALDNPLVNAAPLERVLTAATVQFAYLRLLVWPRGLSSDYSHAQIELVSNPLNWGVAGFKRRSAYRSWHGLVLVASVSDGRFCRGELCDPSRTDEQFSGPSADHHGRTANLRTIGRVLPVIRLGLLATGAALGLGPLGRGLGIALLLCGPDGGTQRDMGRRRDLLPHAVPIRPPQCPGASGDGPDACGGRTIRQRPSV